MQGPPPPSYNYPNSTSTTNVYNNTTTTVTVPPTEDCADYTIRGDDLRQAGASISFDDAVGHYENGRLTVDFDRPVQIHSVSLQKENPMPEFKLVIIRSEVSK